MQVQVEQEPVIAWDEPVPFPADNIEAAPSFPTHVLPEVPPSDRAAGACAGARPLPAEAERAVPDPGRRARDHQSWRRPTIMDPVEAQLRSVCVKV